jgi:hypothetical protein
MAQFHPQLPKGLPNGGLVGFKCGVLQTCWAAPSEGSGGLTLELGAITDEKRSGQVQSLQTAAKPRATIAIAPGPGTFQHPT